MKRNRGFTWIELEMVLGVIAILGALAIPGLQDTTLKKQVREGLDLADIAKKGVQGALSTTGELPRNNDEASLPARDKIVGNMVTAVEVENGAIHVTYGNNASRALTGLTVTLRPAIVKDEPLVPIAWVCHRVAVPAKMEAKGRDHTDVPPKWLPVECRGKDK